MQLWCCPGVEFLYEPLMTSTRQMLGGDGNGWNWLSYFKREVVSEEGERLSREGGYGAFLSCEVCVELNRQCWTDLNVVSKVVSKVWALATTRVTDQRKRKGFCWKRLLLVRNELLLGKTLQREESLIVFPFPTILLHIICYIFLRITLRGTGQYLRNP